MSSPIQSVAIVEVTKVYGNTVIYPRCGVSKEFARIAGTKTLTYPTLEAMKRLGYRLEIRSAELEALLGVES